MTVTADEITALLEMSEGNELDFKRDQYPLQNDEQKGELIKDLLAFANAWKRSDAYILIGVDENPGGRARLVGVSHHLRDADLQQLVNSKTNRPVHFDYSAVTVEGLPIGVLRIRLEQERPLYLRRNFGGLQAHQVPIRRGSSTANASPDDVARMGETRVAAARAPVLTVGFGDSETRRVLGSALHVTSRVLQERPAEPIEELPPALQRALALPRGFARVLETARIHHDGPSRQELHEYQGAIAMLRRVTLAVTNNSSVLAEDVKVEIEIIDSDVVVVDELPEKPTGFFHAISRIPLATAPDTTVEDCGDRRLVQSWIKKIRPKDTAWADDFWIGSRAPAQLRLTARLLASNLPSPLEVPLEIQIDVEEGLFEDDADE